MGMLRLGSKSRAPSCDQWNFFPGWRGHRRIERI